VITAAGFANQLLFRSPGVLMAVIGRCRGLLAIGFKLFAILFQQSVDAFVVSLVVGAGMHNDRSASLSVQFDNAVRTNTSSRFKAGLNHNLGVTPPDTTTGRPTMRRAVMPFTVFFEKRLQIL
jgi:hypothetical protein